jgi:hypothetical protein
MKKSLIQLQSERINREYLYVQSDLEYKRGVVDEYTQEFMTLVRESLGEDNLKQPDSPVKRCSCSIDASEVSEETLKKIKKIYREISKKTHPDRDTEGLYTEENIQATEAYEANDIYTLYQICDIVGIPYEIDEGDLDLIQKLIGGMRDEVKVIEDSYIWLWYIAVNDKMKAALVDSFVKQHKA